MSPSGAASLAGVLLNALALAPMAQAQYGGWADGQVNATMCIWEQLRGHQLRDTIYLDGGLLGWKPGMKTGEYGRTVDDKNRLALMYKLNLGKSFNTTQNISAVLETLPKAPGLGAGNNIAPDYYDGALLGNDKAFYLYGGLLTPTDSFTPPERGDVYAYRGYQVNPDFRSFTPGFFINRLPTNMTRYLAYGGAAAAPSENKAWYFGGQHSPSWGPIYTPSSNNSINAINASNTLITLDMSGPEGSEKWSNVTLPDHIKGRANPELVWVPYGAQGLLIAIGGVTFPEFDNGRRQSANAAASESESKGFTAEVDIYDIAKNQWYRQPTMHSGPGAVTRGCTVVAAAQDMSSVNIYFYGGYNGRDIDKEFYDDVWILSLPSFMWMRVATGQQGYGRAGHKCFKPYPDLMMVIGGQRYQPTIDHLCLQGGMIRLFNLTSATWQESYDPAKWYKYGVPAAIYNMIGGTAEGGARQKQPDPSGFANSDIAGAFASPYPTQKITTYYPYASAASNDNTNSNLPGSSNGGSGVPSYVGPVVGVIGGLILITALIAGFCVYRRRHLLKRDQAGASEVGTTDENGNRIMKWIHGQPSEQKGPPTVTATEETVFTPYMENGLPIPPKSVQSVPSTTPAPTTYTTASSFPAEMADTQMAELMDTSHPPRNELHDQPLSAAEIVNKHSNLARQQNNGGSIHSSNLYSSIVQTDHASVVSRSSAPHAASPAPGAYPGLEPGAPGRPDSPPMGGPAGHDTLGDLPQQQQQQQQNPHDQGPLSPVSRLESGVSGISEGDRRHLRHLSDETVSSFGAGVSAAQANALVSPSSAVAGPGGGQLHPLVGTPPLVSPPEFGGDGDDYLSARAAQAQRPPQPPQRGPSSGSGVGSPLRKSVFHEGE